MHIISKKNYLVQAELQNDNHIDNHIDFQIYTW